MILPLVKPGIIAGSILVFVPSLGAYVTPRVLGGGKNLMLGNLIELQFGQGRNWPLGAALSITLMVIVMVALLIYVRAVAGKRGTTPWLSRRASTSASQTGFTAIAADCVSCCSTRRSSCWWSIRSTPAHPIAIWEGFSLRWYQSAWKNEQVQEADHCGR